MSCDPIPNEYHGNNFTAARARADQIGGCVIRSKGPESKGLQNEHGFWSGEDRFTRSWEAMVYDANWNRRKKNVEVQRIPKAWLS